MKTVCTPQVHAWVVLTSKKYPPRRTLHALSSPLAVRTGRVVGVRGRVHGCMGPAWHHIMKYIVT